MFPHTEIKQTLQTDENRSTYNLSAWTTYGYYVFGYLPELFKNPTGFITDYLYPIAAKEGAAYAPAFNPAMTALGYAPAIFVLGPYDKIALNRLFSWGEGEDHDPKAREPLNRVAKATGTDTIAQFVGEQGIKEHRKIKSHLNKTVESYRLTQQLFQSLTQKWQDKYSYQENIRHLVTNIIAQCIFGIPEVPIEDMQVLQDMSYALANYQPDSEAFQKAAEAFQNSSDKLVQRFGKNIFEAKKYAFDQIREGDNPLERLADIKVGSGILVEGNLSNTIMIAIAQILENKDLLEELSSELAELDLNIVPNSEEHAKELYTTLNRCTLLQKLYVEALRFVSAGVITARKTSRASEWDIKDKEGNTRHFSVPAGSFLFAPLRMMAHDRNIFKDPEVFNPHRFDSYENIREFNIPGLSPFMTGIRSCPAGAQFVKLVFKLAVSITITQHRGLKLDKNMQTIAANSMHPVMEPPCYRVREEEQPMGMALLP